jgi:acetyl esterase
MNVTANFDELLPEMAALLKQVAAETGPQPDPTMLPPAEGRSLTAESNRRWNVAMPSMRTVGETWIEPISALGSERVRLKVLVPPDHGAGAVIFVHGGGFAFCSPETHERCGRVLAQECRLPVLMPDYRLSPEHPYPAGLMDVVATLRGAVEAARPFGVKEGRVILSGDSAGANLALAAILHEQARREVSISGALLFYGTYGGNFHTESYCKFENGPGLTTAKMQRYWHWYVGDSDVSADPLACPLAASDDALQLLPPLHILAAGVDPLLCDSIALHERLVNLGRGEKLTVVPGVTHGFLQNTNDLAAAREALAAAGTAARLMAASD